jgi:Spy/CpxP family protein refolding chaperone
MKKFVVAMLALCTLVGVSSNSSAEDKVDRKNPVSLMVAQFMKQMEKAELTAEQTAKVKELFTKAADEVNTKRTAGGIPTDVLKKRNDATKAAKEAGKKGKEIQEAVDAGLGLPPDQLKLFKETETILTKAKIEIGKLLSPEQIAKLPEQAQNALKAKEGGKKAKAQ